MRPYGCTCGAMNTGGYCQIHSNGQNPPWGQVHQPMGAPANPLAQQYTQMTMAERAKLMEENAILRAKFQLAEGLLLEIFRNMRPIDCISNWYDRAKSFLERPR
jgi:hypothetical protein